MLMYCLAVKSPHDKTDYTFFKEIRVMVFEKVQKIICEQFELDADRVTMESNLISDLGADSLDVIDLAMSIEDEFDIEVPDDEIDNIKTVGDIVKFIDEH